MINIDSIPKDKKDKFTNSLKNYQKIADSLNKQLPKKKAIIQDISQPWIISELLEEKSTSLNINIESPFDPESIA
ncbi:hypothetical protein ACE5IS_19535 [Leptospira wolffii]|uniref:Uncharacterized protein n=1 Tax=Leptospira wolffii TaxID=409998 RepID=A0ABV5BTN2_9LEPT